MKRNSSQHSGLTQRSENISAPPETDAIKSYVTKSLTGSLATLAKSADTEITSHKTYRHDNTRKNYEFSYFKLANVIIEAYLDLKHQTLENNPNLVLILKKVVPFEESDDETKQSDPVMLFQYYRQIHDKNLEFKNDAERELAEKKESGINDYEAALQKLEAEVREHIRIEQQMKLYVDSTQARLEELEQSGDTSKLDTMKQEIEELRKENFNLNEKLKKRGAELESNTKELSHKADIIKKLELQLEALPVLKNKVKELETMLSQESYKSSGPNTLRNYNRNSKDTESFIRALGASISTSGLTHEEKPRKNSQPFMGTYAQEAAKKKGSDKDRNKENYDAMKTELAKYNGDIQRLQLESSRLNSESNRNERLSIVYKTEGQGAKTSRLTNEKLDDLKVVPKAKKPLRSGSTSHLNKERERVKTAEFDLYPEERTSHVRVVNANLIEQSRLSVDRGTLAASGYFGGPQRKMLEKRRGSNPKADYKDTSDMGNMSTSRQKIPKTSRPSTGQERQSYHPETHKLKKDIEVYDLAKLRVVSPKKGSQDRSQSVDAKTRFYKELKSREETKEKEKIGEDKSRRKSSHNIQNKQHTTFTTTHKVNSIF